MKKWIGPCWVVVLVMMLFSLWSPLRLSHETVSGDLEIKTTPAVFGRMDEEDEKEEVQDPHFIQILKILQEKMNGWLKSLNERIEDKEVTRLEVRFLEILRDLLEWVKAKIDAKIESSKKEQVTYRRPMNSDQGGFFALRG